ncbi:MAG: tetratricopeptide repeat protein, partial [Chlamydiae bacterium]|nr:tetratricopeptide repeat protein [Chlamydiota bacterium]
MLKVISAIYSCGSFIEKKLFAKVFDLSLSSIDRLEELGLIHWDADAWNPHPLLNEIAESEPAITDVDQEKAIEYWYRQLKPKREKRKLDFWIGTSTLLVVLICLIFYFLPTPPHHIVNLRQTHPDFVGREAYLNQLKSICLKSKKSPSIAVLWGEAGIGKSEIAIAFANEYARHFRVIGWIDSETDESYAASFYTLAKLLEIPVDKETDVVRKVHHYLETENKAQPWLLILDNAEQNRALPAIGKGSVIVTTQNRTHWPLQNCIEVTSFQENEATDLFKKITHNSLQNHELIKELEFFPLTLNLAAHYIAEIPDMNEELYLKLLSQKELELISSMPENIRYPHTLLSSWNLKASELAEKNSAVLEWLHFCSYLCPSGIPSCWIEPWLADREKGKDSFELKIRSGNILRTLVSHSLMRFEKQTHTLSLHRLKQDVMKKDRYSQKDIIDQIAQFLISRSEKIEKIYEKEKTLSQWDHLREWEPHVTWFLNHCETSLSKEKEASLQNLLANWKFIKGDYQAAQPYHEQALERRIELFGEAHPQTIISMNNLATVLWENGQLAKSKELFTKALTASRKLYPEEHIDDTIAMNNLGWVSWEMGEFQEAKTLLKQSLLTSKKLRACDPDFLQVANDFIQELDDSAALSDSERATMRALFLRHAGLWVAEVEGNPNKSIGYFKESLELLQQTLPENDPRIAIALGSLGISCNRAGQNQEGQYYLSEALKIQRLVLGDEHPETAKSYANLAISFLNLEKSQKALEYHQKALD